MVFADRYGDEREKLVEDYAGGVSCDVESSNKKNSRALTEAERERERERKENKIKYINQSFIEDDYTHMQF